MKTLLFLLAALSSIPLAILYEKQINYIAHERLSNENTKANISYAEDTTNCSKLVTEKALKCSSANLGKESFSTEETIGLSKNDKDLLVTDENFKSVTPKTSVRNLENGNMDYITEKSKR